MSNKLAQVDHSILRYTNCWEDAELLLAALDLNETSKVLSIGSAGDNSFSLLVKNPAKVLCIDVNQTQLALIELKKAAFLSLTHAEFLVFLGFRRGNRLPLFERVKTNLSESDQYFWMQRLALIENGLIYQGKFEQYLLTFQKRILPFIHSQKRVKQLLSSKSETAQNTFYSTMWNSKRWSFFTKIFFSRKLLSWGRDPVFLEQVEGKVGKKIRARIHVHLSSMACQVNPMLHFMLLGKFGNTLPHYARVENFEHIKHNAPRLSVHCGDVLSVNENNFTHANLSNIFEYMDAKTFSENAKVLAKKTQKNGTLAYWNLLVKRELSVFNNLFQNTTPSNLKPDFGFFYAGFKTSKIL